jgi:hypothetical protein
MDVPAATPPLLPAGAVGEVAGSEEDPPGCRAEGARSPEMLQATSSTLATANIMSLIANIPAAFVTKLKE